tara:strand:+ start:360 stop:947 length:588 start_codon:yes stop_codon:yes gene_type:complete
MIKIEKRFFFILSFSIALIVAASNYLVQFPITYSGLENFLTYGAFSYPVTFLITDLSNRKYGKNIAKKIVYLGFVIGICLTFFIALLDFIYIPARIALGSATAFLTAQLIDVYIFDKLRDKIWFVAPLTSSLVGSTVDTFLFFSISFYGTGVNWISLSAGDLFVKIFVALIMLIPFRLLLSHIREVSSKNNKINA